jgi:hypothetical protein
MQMSRVEDSVHQQKAALHNDQKLRMQDSLQQMHRDNQKLLVSG